jgi:hypothetical protein
VLIEEIATSSDGWDQVTFLGSLSIEADIGQHHPSFPATDIITIAAGILP